MSQHYFRTIHNNKPILVLMGWDRPLQQFFLVVEDTEATEDEYLYSNLFDTETFAAQPELSYYEGKLQELGIKVPHKMIEEVLRDRARNVGNRIVNYNAEGVITESKPA